MKEGWFEGVDGTKLYYRTTGKGIPIILNDGIGCDGFIWKYFLEYFRDRYQIVHWHYKGHGQSHYPENFDHLSIPDLCQDLGKLCDILDLPPAVIAGHSMGVQVVYEFWHMFPEKTLGLIPICGSYGNPLDTFHDNSLLKTVFPFVKQIVQKQPDITKKLWETIVHSELAYQIATKLEVNGRLISREDFEPYFYHIGNICPDLFSSMLTEAQEHDGRPFLPKIDIPVLIVGGERDTFTPMWLSKDMQRLIPEAELIMVPEGSHTAPIELPELVNLRIEKFLRDRVEPLVKKAKATKKKKKTKAKASRKTKKAANKKVAS